MEQRIQPGRKLIRGAFARLMIINMFVLVATCICSFVDNLVIVRRLGEDALAAAGYFSPISTAIGTYYMIVLGTQILCGNFIGAGKKDQIHSLFISSFTVLGVFCSAVSVLGILFRDPISSLLGAQGAIREMLSDYMLGYLPSIPLQALCALLTALAAFNNDMRRSYISAGVMTVGNAAMDLLLAGLGTLGIGLATTLSSAAAFFVLLPGYRKKDRMLQLTHAPLDLKLVGRAALRGLPSLMFTVGLVIKNTLMIKALNTYQGAEGVAVANVLFSVCSIAGILTGGCNGAYSTLAGLYYGEEDRESFLSLFRIALRIGLACCIGIAVVSSVFSSHFATMFFTPGTTLWDMGQKMFLLGFLFFPFNIIYSLLLNSYQAQGKMKLVNFLSAAEPALIGLTALATVPGFGLNAAWLANTWVDLLCIGIILTTVWIWKGKIDLRLPSLLKLDDEFGALPEECREYAVSSLEDVVNASGSICAFCKDRAVQPRSSFFAGLCVEEMARNILEYGTRPGKHPQVDIRVVARDELTVRIRDNCPEFDPRKRVDQFDPDDPERNIGIRLTAGISEQMDYYSQAGVNTLIMKI